MSRFDVDIIGQNYDLTLWFLYDLDGEIKYHRHDIQRVNNVEDDEYIDGIELLDTCN